MSASAYQMFSAIHVADNGPGIPEDEQPKVFQRFYRGLSNPTEEGVGIGLYLVRQIAEGQGGYVKVSSKPGEGSTFPCTSPVKSVNTVRFRKECGKNPVVKSVV